MFPVPKPPDNAEPCPCCRKQERLVLPGAVCFDCERQASREVANDMPKIMDFLRPRLEFKNWRIEHGDVEP